MRLTALIALALLGAAANSPALASPCSDEIDSLSKRVNEEGREAIAASTSGQAVAGAREGQGVTGSTAEAGASQAPPEKSAEAGKGAEKAQAAKVALDEARTLDAKGDASGCSDALTRVRNALSEAP